jgi:hypothetical protein
VCIERPCNGSKKETQSVRRNYRAISRHRNKCPDGTPSLSFLNRIQLDRGTRKTHAARFLLNGAGTAIRRAFFHGNDRRHPVNRADRKERAGVSACNKRQVFEKWLESVRSIPIMVSMGRRDPTSAILCRSAQPARSGRRAGPSPRVGRPSGPEKFLIALHGTRVRALHGIRVSAEALTQIDS